LATAAPFAKYVFDQLPAMAYLGLRPFIAATVAFGALRMRRMDVRIGRAAWCRLVVVGGLGYGLAQAGFVAGLDRTSVSHLSSLILTSPLLGALIVPLVAGRLPRRGALAGMALGFAGVSLLVGGGGDNGASLGGDALVLTSALTWVGATIWSRLWCSSCRSQAGRWSTLSRRRRPSSRGAPCSTERSSGC